MPLTPADPPPADEQERIEEGLEELLPEPASAIASRLTDGQIEEIASLLRAGRRLPPYLFPHLFQTAREYELTYRVDGQRWVESPWADCQIRRWA